MPTVALTPTQDGHQNLATWADGTVGLVLFLGGGGLLFDAGASSDEPTGLSLDLTLVTGTLGPHSGTLSVYIVDEADPAPFSVSRLPGDLPKTLLSTEVLSGLPSNSSIPHTVDLGSPTMLPGWAGKIALVLTWLGSVGQNVGAAATESGFPSVLNFTTATAEELDAMARHAARQTLDRIVAALRASALEQKVIEEDPSLIDLSDEIPPGGLITVTPVEEDTSEIGETQEGESRMRRRLEVSIGAVALSPIQRDEVRLIAEKTLSAVSPSAPIRELDLSRVIFVQRREAEKRLWAADLRYGVEYHILEATPDEPIDPAAEGA